MTDLGPCRYHASVPEEACGAPATVLLRYTVPVIRRSGLTAFCEAHAARAKREITARYVEVSEEPHWGKLWARSRAAWGEVTG